MENREDWVQFESKALLRTLSSQRKKNARAPVYDSRGSRTLPNRTSSRTRKTVQCSTVWSIIATNCDLVDALTPSEECAHLMHYKLFLRIIYAYAVYASFCINVSERSFAKVTPYDTVSSHGANQCCVKERAIQVSRTTTKCTIFVRTIHALLTCYFAAEIRIHRASATRGKCTKGRIAWGVGDLTTQVTGCNR